MLEISELFAHYIEESLCQVNTFSNILFEAKSNYGFEILRPDDLVRYMQKVGKKLPKLVQDALYLTHKYNLLDPAIIDDIRLVSKSSVRTFASLYNIPINEAEDLWDIFKSLKINYKLLPQYQSPAEREGLEKGRLQPSDITIDLDTPAGKNAVIKMYMPVVYKIVNQYVGKSNFSKQELISSALEGFALAMNTWKHDRGDGQKSVAFKTMAAYKIQQQILNDINKYSHTLSGGNSYNTRNGSSHLDAFSLDRMLGVDDNGDFKQDHLKALGMTDQEPPKDSDKLWNNIYQILDKQFKQKDLDIFYRFFGLHGYKREKSKDIAKSLGMSEGNIRNSYINKIIKFLKSDPRTSEILADIQTVYNESLMCELFERTREEIMEFLINDDMFILLEDINRWNNPKVLNNAIQNVYKKMPKDDINTIQALLDGGFELLDNNFKKNKKLIIYFLNNLYPTENMSYKTDVSLLDYMMEIQKALHK